MSGITAIVAFFVLALGACAGLARTVPQGDSNIELAKKFFKPATSLISPVPSHFNYEVQWDGRLTITLQFPT